MTSSFEDGDQFNLRDDLVVEQVDDEIIVLDLEGNQYFGLNEVGWMIWEAIEDDQDFGAIADEIASRFDIDADRARDDAAAFVGQLVEAGLAQCRTPDQP